MLRSRNSVAQYAQDDGFHEIQLGGKQLVFLFMAASVVSAVIFLCGVLVGRGVRAERAATIADSSALTPFAVPDVAAVPQAAPTPAGSDPTVAAPPPAVDDLSYFNRLEKQGPPVEELRPATEQPRGSTLPAPANERRASAATERERTVPVAREPPPVREPSVKPSDEKPTSGTASAEPAGQGFALQITALRERGEAEAIAKRLSKKGYTAYVLTPAAKAPAVYRVRVGKFKTRREAETVAAKLQKEEQFTPWITR